MGMTQHNKLQHIIQTIYHTFHIDPGREARVLCSFACKLINPPLIVWATIGFTEKISVECHHKGHIVRHHYRYVQIGCYLLYWTGTLKTRGVSSEWSRDCNCKPHVLSIGIITYSFIYSCSCNTYPIILLLEACISQIHAPALRFAT